MRSVTAARAGLILAAILLLWGAPARGAPDQDAATTEQATPQATAPGGSQPQGGPVRGLSALEIDKFLVDWPRFVTWAREHGVEFDRPEAPDALFEEILEREAAAFIKSMGWEPDRFNHVLERITALLSGLAMAENRDRIRSAHRAERIEIENNPDLTESERSQRLQALDQSWARMEEFAAELEKAGPRELELIRTNREKLMKLIKKTYRGR